MIADSVEFWRTGWPTDGGPIPVGAEPDNYVYKFILHGPLGRALRNHEITRQYWTWADLLAAEFPPGTPTWWHFAGWTSAQVGALIRAPLPGNARMAQALSVGNTDVYANTTVVAELIAQPQEGSLPLPDSSVEPTRDHFLTHADGIALAVYRAAQTATHVDPQRARELVALGNLCLLAREQQLLSTAIAVAPRVRLRQLRRLAFLDPRPSLREWRQEVPSPCWMTLENRLAPKLVALRPLELPWGSIRIRDGVPGFRMPEPWPAMPAGLESWHPFRFFEPNGAAPGCYLCLDARLRYLYALLWTHQDMSDWRSSDQVPLWTGAPKAKTKVQRVLQRLPLPSSYAARAASAVPPPGVQLSTDRHLGLDDGDDNGDAALRIFDSSEAQRDLAVSRRIYREHRSWVAIAFLARSLPASFAAADGASLLAPRTSGVTKLSARREQRGRTMAGDAAWRSGGTLEFVDDVLGWSSSSADDDPEQHERRLRRAIETTRRKHATYRNTFRLIADDPQHAESPAAQALRSAKGVPVNLVDAVGVAGTFTASVHQFFERFVPQAVSSPADWDAWARTWARVAIAIGAPIDMVSTEDPDGSRSLFDMATMTAVGEYIDALSVKPSAAGIYLMENFLRDVHDAVPRWQRRFVRLGVQLFGDDRHLVPLLIDVGPMHRLGRRSIALLARVPVLGGLWIGGVEVMMRPVLAKLQALVGSEEIPVSVRFPSDCTTTDVRSQHERDLQDVATCHRHVERDVGVEGGHR